MSKELFYFLQVSSTMSASFPLVLGLLKFKKADLNIRLFIIFLMIGFLTDLFGWYFYLSKNSSANVSLRFMYNLIEPVFLFWFVSQFSSHKIIKIVFAKAWIVLLPFWTISIFYKEIFALFKTTTEVFLAFASSFCILTLVEKQENSTSQPVFWLLIGIFFYNFCTFFFMSLVTSKMGFNLWYIHNIINIISNLIYFSGLITIFRSSPRTVLRRPIL